jgi:hypothetical protein
LKQKNRATKTKIKTKDSLLYSYFFKCNEDTPEISYH